MKFCLEVRCAPAHSPSGAKYLTESGSWSANRSDAKVMTYEEAIEARGNLHSATPVAI